MKRIVIANICLAAAAVVALAQPPLGYKITNFAGNGTAGFAGDSGTATDAQLNSPSSLAFDSQGNLYVADQLNSRVRKITGTTISTVAGKGDRGFSGDTGQATAALLSYPQAITLDSQGSIYIADSFNGVIRKVTSAGIITSIAGGTAVVGFAGDGGPAVDASINFPQGVAVDSAGNLYFSDSGNLRIRKIGTDGKISTFAGIGSQGLTGDGGPALQAYLNNPTGLAFDSAGNLYICDTDNGKIRKINTDGIITTVAGNGANGFSGDGGLATSAMLNHPRGVAVDSAGLIYIADTFNSRIRVVSRNGTISTIAGNGYIGESGLDGPARDAILRFPAAVAVTADGRIYIADTQNNRIKLLTATPAAPPSAPPTITSGGVVTAGAYGASAAAAPGSWIEIFGTNFATVTREWVSSEFVNFRGPQVLEGTRVTVGGKPAYVSFISPAQVNAQIPSDVGTGPQAVTVTTAAGTSNTITMTINPTQGGLLAPPSFRVGGRQYVAALLSDGRSYALPPATIGISTRPARPGETVIMYGVGFGPTTPTVNAGEITQTAANVAASVQILFGQTPATVSYAGLAPGSVGLYQFNVVVPQVPDNDATPLTFTVGGAASSQALVIATKR